MKVAALPLHKIGAVLYGLWGFWHFQVVARTFDAATQMEQGVLQARIYQGAFHILWFAVGAIAIAILFNWRNSRIGYWANLIMIGWTEVGLLLFFILPGYFPWLPTGFIGHTPMGSCCFIQYAGVLSKSKEGVILTTERTNDEEKVLYRPAS